MARGGFRVLGTPMFFELTSCVRPDEGPGQRRAEGFSIGQALSWVKEIGIKHPDQG